MASRPAKRQRRSTTIFSDDDEEQGLPSSTISTNKTKGSKSSLQHEITLDGKTSLSVSPVKATTRSKTTSKRTAPKASPKSSPEKPKKNTKAQKQPEKSKSLHTFFTKATEEQRWRKRSETPDVVVDVENGELGDAIEDDDLSDDTLQELGRRTDRASSVHSDRRKPTVPALSSLRNGSSGGSLPSSQRFVRTTTRKETIKVKVEEQDVSSSDNHRPWADRYGPINLDELVVHKKKVADVQGWLQGKISGRNSQKLLVLKGPAGSGKTTTLSLLAEAMGLDLVSWHNPAVADTGPNNSIALQFDEFLNRGGQFGGLAFDTEAVAASDKDSNSGRILVIEEFPATITRYSSTVNSFRSVLLRYLARASNSQQMGLRGQTSSAESPPPVVIIISETLLSSSTALADSFTAHRLLGPEILNHPYVTAMDFNPVAHTFVTKALDLVVKKEARDSGRRRIPGPAIMHQLAEIGDVRSAVNALEFLCLRGDDDSTWSGTVAAKPKKSSKDKNGVPLTETEKNSLQMVSQRETTLDMFHAAGKIVYNKREDPRVQDTRAEPPPKPPDHLMHLYTPKASLVDIEALLNETGTDIQTFISTLHENYILSCNGDIFEETFEGCSDILSISDVLNPDSRPARRANNNPNASLIRSNLQSGSSDTLRQDEISFQVATRGLLFNLPYPVNRANVPGGKRGDNFKMFYPQSLRLWKANEEIDSLVEMFARGLHTDTTNTNASDSIPVGGGGVESWRSRTFGIAHSLDSGSDDDGCEERSIPPRIQHNRDNLTLEILPFMARILSARHEDTKVIDRITHLRPNAMLPTPAGNEESFEDETNEKETSLVPQMKSFRTQSIVGGTEGTSQNLTSAGMLKTTSNLNGRGASSSGSAVPAPAMENLYLEDDDIVDD